MQKQRASKIDGTLERLCEHQKKFQHLTYTRDELSALCNCDKELIRIYEMRALKKIRARLSKEDWETLTHMLSP